MIYADNAATTQLDKDAFEAMRFFLTEDYGNASQPYSYARTAKKALREARSVIAECIGAMPEEIYFTSGGTESDNWAIKGMLRQGDCRRTVTDNIEHHAVLNVCSAIERLGFPVTYIPADGHGLVRTDALENAIGGDTRLVSVMLANNEIGTIEPVEQLARISHEHGALFHTDAVQAVGHIPIDVKKLGIDMMSASAHKFNGPKGIGFMFIKKGTDIFPYADGGAQESHLRAGTENIASIVAMSVALQKNSREIKETTNLLAGLENEFISTLDEAGLDYMRNGSRQHLPGNINISIRGADGEMLLHRLDLKGICISTGSACDSKNTQVSHVIKAIGVSPEYAYGTVRVTFGRYNHTGDGKAVAAAILDVMGKS